MKGSLIA